MAGLNYALFDLLIAEVIALLVAKKYRFFTKSEYYVFGSIAAGTILFYLSNQFQEKIIEYLASFGGWLVLTCVVVFCFNMIIFARFNLGRKWTFRLVLIPILIIIFAFVIVVIRLYKISNP